MPDFGEDFVPENGTAVMAPRWDLKGPPGTGTAVSSQHDELQG